LNAVAATLVVISLVNIGIYEIKTANLGQEEVDEEGYKVNLENPDNLPDIYYIILDGYTRADTLEEAYNYDNSQFIDYLTDKGFYVASKSQCNYPITCLSMASSLDMEYLDNLSDALGRETTDLSKPLEMIRNNKVSQFLKSKGYRYVFVPTNWGPPGMGRYADIYLNISKIGISNFSPELMRRAHRALAKRGIPLASNQVRYSLLDRHIETDGTLEAAKELGVTIIAYSPLAQGVLTGKFHRDPGLINKLPFMRRRIVRRMLEKSRLLVEMMGEVSTFYGVSTAQIALNWLINYNGDTVVAIPGATRAEQAAQNARAMSFALSPSDMKRLDSLCIKPRVL